MCTFQDCFWFRVKKLQYKYYRPVTSVGDIWKHTDTKKERIKDEMSGSLLRQSLGSLGQAVIVFLLQAQKDK